MTDAGAPSCPLAVRGGVGPHQHRLGHVRAHPGRHRVGRGTRLHRAPVVAGPRRARAGRVGPRQHRGRFAQVPRLRPRAAGPASAPRAAQRAAQDVDAPQRDVDPQQFLPRQEPAAELGAYLARPLGPHQAHLLARRRGPDRRVLGHLVPVGWLVGQDPGRHRVGRRPPPRRPPHAPLDGGPDARPAQRRQHRHGRRPADAGRPRVGRAPGAPRAPVVAQGGHPQGGVLDRLEHHGRQPAADPGRFVLRTLFSRRRRRWERSLGPPR